MLLPACSQPVLSKYKSISAHTIRGSEPELPFGNPFSWVPAAFGNPLSWVPAAFGNPLS
jgi:hypothetical protein